MNEDMTTAALPMGGGAGGLDTFPSPPSIEARPKSRRGFASMTAEKRAEISRKGGTAAHAAGSAHRFTSDEAKAAGKKGGLAKHRVRGRTPVEE